MKKLIFLFSLFAITYSLSPGVIHAQEVSLSIAPPLTELTIQPGKSFSQTFTVKNNGMPVVIVPKIFPFVPLDRLGHAEIIEDKTTLDAFNGWFIFDQSPYSLGENGTHDFIVKITPPGWAEEKDYYFTFLVETQNDNNIGVNNTQAQARVGANILINTSKDGNPTKKASIIDFSAPRFIDSFWGLNYKVLIGNSGSSFFKPTGKITIDQIVGGKTTTLNLAPLNVLVGGKREVFCIEGQDLVPCSLPGKFLIGIYRANLSFTIDGSGESIEKQTYTVAFPFTVLLGLVMIGFSYYLITKFQHLKTMT